MGDSKQDRAHISIIENEIAKERQRGKEFDNKINRTLATTADRRPNYGRRPAMFSLSPSKYLITITCQACGESMISKSLNRIPAYEALKQHKIKMHPQLQTWSGRELGRITQFLKGD